MDLRLCYVGHSFHERSKSTVFMLEIMREIGEVEVFTSDPDSDSIADDVLVSLIGRQHYDCVVFLQTEHIAARLRASLKCRFIIVPMYDGASGRPDHFWKQFVNSHFISFSRRHHEHLEAIDCQSSFFQFFPKPCDRPVRDFTHLGAFFWERRPDKSVNEQLVLNLCRQLNIETLHVHAAPDFMRHARPFSRLPAALTEGIAISRSTWFEDKDDYDRIAAEPLFYFAPRPSEGIGMAVLEAMSRGQIVVAPDRPTMNEYIRHGTTGILYDPAEPHVTPFPDIGALQKISDAAYLKVVFGRDDWCRDIERLRSMLIGDNRRWSTRDVSSHFMNSLRAAASERMFGLYDQGRGASA